MLSVRVNRDRRGYDHVYLVEETRRRGRAEGRLLYWSRLPGGLRVGRELFDAETRVALEKANPGTTFDWPFLLKNVSASAAAARWTARQQQQRSPASPASPAPPAPRGDRRPSSKPAPRRSWREEGDETPEDSRDIGEVLTVRGEAVGADAPLMVAAAETAQPESLAPESIEPEPVSPEPIERRSFEPDLDSSDPAADPTARGD